MDYDDTFKFFNNHFTNTKNQQFHKTFLGNDASKVYSNTSMLFFTMMLQSISSATVSVRDRKFQSVLLLQIILFAR